MKLLAQHTIFVAIVSYTLIFERRMFSDDPTYHTFTMDFYGTLKGWTKEKIKHNIYKLGNGGFYANRSRFFVRFEVDSVCKKSLL